MGRKCTALVFGLLCMSAGFAQEVSADYDSLIQNALEARNRGDLSTAESHLREALPIPEDKSEVLSLLAMVIAFQERFIEALALLEEPLAADPENISLRLTRARILSYQGDYQSAMSITMDILEQSPSNAEALTLAGRISLYQSSPGRARDYFQQALTVDEASLDAWLGLYDSARAQGDSAAGERALGQAQEIAPDNIEVQRRLNPQEFTVPRPHTLTAGFGNSHFNRRGFSEWYDRFVEYRYQQGNGNEHYLRLDHNHRFGEHDTQMEAGLQLGQDTALPISLALALTPDADFMPYYLLRGAATFSLREAGSRLGATLLNVQYQLSSFANGDTHRLSAGLEYYLLSANAWLTPSVGLVRDQDGLDSFSWSLGAHWQINGLNRIGFNYSDAPETENLITTETRVYNAYWRHDLADNLQLRLTADRIVRRNSYTREQLSLQLQYHF